MLISVQLPFPYRRESDVVARHLQVVNTGLDWAAAAKAATPWVQSVRDNPPPFWAMESLLREYPISSAEGLALMRLAEALLRVPDAETAIALTADTAILTACGNDYGYERVFARQIEALGTAGDTLIAFSTSGKSKNIKEAIHAAHKKGMRILGISGNKGMNALCAIDIICPGSNTAIIQECHMVVTHLLCQAIERGVPK